MQLQGQTLNGRVRGGAPFRRAADVGADVTRTSSSGFGGLITSLRSSDQLMKNSDGSNSVQVDPEFIRGTFGREC